MARLGLLLYLALVLTAPTGCGPTPTATVTPSATATPFPVVTDTRPPTVAPTPSATPTPILTPLPLSTATPSATQTAAPTTAPTVPTLYTYRVIHTYPHDPAAFTQGLVYTNGVLYEGTGLWGESTLRRVDLATGAVEQSLSLDARYFGEGIAVWGDRIVQLTWRSEVGFVYRRDTFDLQRTFTYPTEGWGLTHDGSRLIMSDGSATLHFLHPDTYAEIGRVIVHEADGRAVSRLNELEYIHGEVYANVWLTDRVARIDPRSGQVTAWVDLSGLLAPEEQHYTDVLNGIAHDVEGDRLFVTGKLWPKLFHIELLPVR